ncbi:metallophosphoesterase [Dysgonomonas sp. 520]|uniref:metallophosphoesterase n=1 Tax=Dysgonomonas sp. 520 TaxID=2302931 RepID=UPI002105D112|nr:metallophosphoesterase [Dysgonomonas sp. 520]
MILIYLLGNFYVFYRAWTAMPPTPVGRAILITVGCIVTLSLILSFVLGNILPAGIVSILYKIGSSWIFILIYLVLFNLIKDLFGLLVRWVSFIPNDAITRYTKENWVGFAFMVGFIALLMLCGYLKYRWKVRVDQPIYTEKAILKSASDSIPSSDSLKIVAISDLHLGYSIGDKEFKSWVELINKEKPDLVLIAGDVIDNNIEPVNKGRFAEYFKQINSKYGIYACLGNHEYISGLKESTEFFKKSGINLLRDSYVEVDSSFYIVGRDDRSNENRKPLNQLMAGIDKSKPIILLDHQPYHLEEAESSGVDFQFSGHTHRGQVWPISMITDIIYEKSFGYLKKGKTNYYISSGIGLWGGKFRIGTQSEYVVVTIKQETAQ